MSGIYDFDFTLMNGKKKKIADYQGKVLVIVNTASKCGHTPQFTILEKLYQQYGPNNFKIIGFPCNQFMHQDPGTNEEINAFCQKNYGVTFEMAQKVKVKGKEAIPLFKYLVEKATQKPIRWNFTKFLIDKKGNVVRRLEPKESPFLLETDLKKLL
jgi:glutathione peroxidase